MKKLILLASLFLVGCKITEEQRRQICFTCPSKIEVRDSISYVHDTVKITIPGKPGPTIYLENPCKLICDSLGRLKPVNIKQQKNGQILHINTLGGGLNIHAETKDTTAKSPILNKQTFHSEKTDTPKFIPCQDERTDFDGFCRYWFWATLLLLFIIAGLKGLQWYFKRLKSKLP